MTSPFRRIVTGHDDSGRAIILSDAEPTRVQSIGTRGTIFHEVWNTQETPARIDRRGAEPFEPKVLLAPPKNGTRIRVVDIRPDDDEVLKMDVAMARAHYAEVGAAEASTHGGSAPHPFMHRTQTIDYGIVLEGEIVLIVDDGEATVRAGDIVVQRGTSHAWANRSGKICRIAFVLIDGEFTDGLP